MTRKIHKKIPFRKNMGFNFCDLDRTNFYKFYGRFEEIGVLDVEAVFIYPKYFGLDSCWGLM